MGRGGEGRDGEMGRGGEGRGGERRGGESKFMNIMNQIQYSTNPTWQTLM